MTAFIQVVRGGMGFVIGLVCDGIVAAGGFLFAVVNPLDTVVQFGVRLGAGGPGQTNISLYYTQPDSFTSEVPSFTKFPLSLT